MTTEQINNLLQRYEQGSTTEAEEQSLRQLAAQGLLSGEWNDYFAALDGAVDVPEGLEDRLSRRIDAMQARDQLRYGQWWHSVVGVAASLAILMTVGLYVHNQHQTQAILDEDTYTDPQEAYNQTEQVLTKLSLQLNKGDDGMQAREFMTQKLNNKNKTL